VEAEEEAETEGVAELLGVGDGVTSGVQFGMFSTVTLSTRFPAFDTRPGREQVRVPGDGRLGVAVKVPFQAKHPGDCVVGVQPKAGLTTKSAELHTMLG